MHPDPAQLTDIGEIAEALADVIDSMLPDELDALRRSAAALRREFDSPTLDMAASYLERMAELTLAEP